ncbi:hypothetical protein TWF481_011523 [Arthrobotrys musiformis]|uniref:Uncharacterized protein n=1 Tax=Arthrobotrys musiformis TaxID=47236 RepID=A0AAV9VYT4_9PEZI
MSEPIESTDSVKPFKPAKSNTSIKSNKSVDSAKSSDTTVTTRQCWQRSPRSQPPTYAHHIATMEEFDSLLTINSDSRAPLLFFASDAHPHHLFIAGTLERLATIYHPKILFCVINMTGSGKKIALPIAKRYEIDIMYATTAVLLEEGKVKYALEVPLQDEMPAIENFIRTYLHLEPITQGGFGEAGMWSHYRTGTTI